MSASHHPHPLADMNPRAWVFDCDMKSVRLYHEKLQAVVIPHAYFINPINKFMYSVTRAVTLAQKYRQAKMVFPLLVATFLTELSHRFPLNDDKRLGFRRRPVSSSCSGGGRKAI
jgi:hypothetical protein